MFWDLRISYFFERKVIFLETGNQFLGTERVSKLMRQYAVPCIISLLVGALYNIVDQIFIANASYLGSYGNAANTVVFPLTVVALAIAVMVGDGCCAFVSMALGRNEMEKAKRSVGNAVVLSVVSSLVLTVVYLVFANTIIAMFGVFQLAALKLDRRTLGRIGVGLAYTYIGLVLFLAGANIGFMPAGNYLGQVLAGQSFRWLLVPIGMLIGYFIVKAEPAVYVLNKQVEEVTDGAISAGTMGAALSAGVSLSVGLAMVRVLTGISILWFLIPGYAFAIGISFVVPKLYTAIAFDAGGVASGPMTATFLLPLAQGACVAVGGNIVTDAFGVVAMVAMTPLITVQLMGLMAQLKQRRARQAQPVPAAALAFADLPDDAIIEL